MRQLLLLLAPVLLLASCRKEKDNIRSILISGTVYNVTNQAAMTGVNVKIYWAGPGLQETQLATTTTNAQGTYSIRLSLDISRFSNQSLEVAAQVPEGYLSIHDLEHHSVGASTVGYYTDDLVMPRFDMYRSAPLNINLQRTGSDPFISLQLFYRYNGRDYWVNPTNPTPSGVTSFPVITAAGKTTTVHWMKYAAPGATPTTYSDSVVCQPGNGNAITIPY